MTVSHHRARRDRRSGSKRRRGLGVCVNADIPLPVAPGLWVNETRCLCGQVYQHFRAHPDWMECVQRIRGANGGWYKGGGFRSRGPVLHVMRCAKLEAWYQSHFGCAMLLCDACCRAQYRYELCPICQPLIAGLMDGES
jgi:hypothetical protein